MRFDWLAQYYSLIVSGALTTFALLVLSAALGFPLAVLIGFGRISRNPLISRSCAAFTSIIRGTPLLVQIYFLYYGLGGLMPLVPWIRQGFLWPIAKEGFYYVVLALTLSCGGYVGEIVRGALLAVPRGELEAGRAFGFHGFSLVRRIWLPRALQAMIPTFAGETVLLLKATALASTITVLDLLGQVNIIRSKTYLTYEPLLTLATVYLVITLLIEAGFRRFERHYAKTHRPA